MDGEHKSYSFKEIRDRVWRIISSAWPVAQSSAPDLLPVSLEDVQILPAKPDGARVAIKVKTADHEVPFRVNVLANGDFVQSQPEMGIGFGSIFDDQADKRLASAIARAIRKR
jgi:hypothetical protein